MKFKKSSFSVIILGLSLLWIVAIRSHTFNEPLERDAATYMVIANEMLHGKTLYVDLWDHKPPAIHLTFCAAQLIGGYGLFANYFLNVVGALIVMLGLFKIGSSRGSPSAGLWMAALWAVLSGDLNLQGNQPNAELFMNASLVWGFYHCLKGVRLSMAGAFFAGVLFGWGGLYKHVALIPAALIIAVFACSDKSNRKSRAGLLLLGAITPWFVTFLVYAAGGQFDLLWQALVKSNLSYMGVHQRTPFLDDLPLLFNSLRSHFDIQLLLVATVGVIVVSFLMSWRRRQIDFEFLLGAYGFGSLVAVILPGYFFLHYYQLLLPVLIIGLVWFLREKSLVVVLMALAVYEISFLRLPPEEWSRRKYGDVFVVTKRLAGEVEAMLAPGETIYNWGDDPELYVYLKQRPPTGILIGQRFLRRMVADFSERILTDLEKSPPDLIVITKWDTPDKIFGNPVGVWIRENYAIRAEVPLSVGFYLAARRESALDHRLQNLSGHPMP